MAGDDADKHPRGRRRQAVRAGALAVSLLLHGAAGLFLVGAASGELVSGGRQGLDVGEVFAVSLVQPSGGAEAEPEDSHSAAPLRLKLRPAPSDLAIVVDADRRSDPMSRLMQRLRREPPAPSEARPAPARAPTPSETVETAAARRGGGEARDSDAQGPTASAAATGDLWGRIEPCWRKDVRRAAVPVTLEISIDSQGRLSAPPKILRGARTALDEQQLASEERALSSLNACLPRQGIRLGKAVYRLEFRP